MKTSSLQAQARYTRTKEMLRVFSSRPEALVAFLILALWALLVLFAPLVATHNPLDVDLPSRLLAPSREHFLGTDSLGRDIFSRLLYGAQTTFFSILLTASLMAPLGLFLGMLAGYMGGAVDLVISRVIDLFFSIPRLILSLVFVAILGPSLINAILAIVITSWPTYAKTARSETLSLKRAEFIQAARLQGASTWRLLRRYLFPMCLSSLLVRLSMDLGGIILSIAAIGFLGLGAKPPSPEWGAMAAEGRNLLLSHWWVSVMPGLAIFTVSLSCNLVGNAIRGILQRK